jgi:small subunit ribosomal protein S12
MATIQQIFNIPRVKKNTKADSPKLNQNPQKKAICLKVLTISPKKPNSANRRVIKARFLSNKMKLTAKIPGESHNIQQHSTVLVRGARVKDLIGVSYSLIRGKFDLNGVINRKRRRSVYGVKKITQ